MKIYFDWDNNNIKHLFEENSERELTIEEIESVFYDKNSIIEESTLNSLLKEKRFKCLGKSVNNKLIIVIFTITAMKLRPITAWQTSKKKYIKLYENER
ncbi:MAG: BrnT family toxin [Cytophagales bacterium]